MNVTGTHYSDCMIISSVLHLRHVVFIPAVSEWLSSFLTAHQHILG